MEHKKKNSADETAPKPDPEERPGSGALCDQAQADGVPCFEIGRECETCEHVKPSWRNRPR